MAAGEEVPSALLLAPVL
jgi:hypothetical protein